MEDIVDTLTKLTKGQIHASVQTPGNSYPSAVLAGGPSQVDRQDLVSLEVVSNV